MNPEAKKPRFGLASIIVATLVLALGWGSTATAQQVKSQLYSLTGNTRNQIGDGLPLPITLAPIPNGKVNLSGFVRQTTGADPKAMIFAQSGLQWGPNTATIGVFPTNSNVFEVQTSLIFQAPHQKEVFKAGGRSGPQNFLWCPGQRLPDSTFAPNCTNPATTVPTTTFGAIVVKGSLQYIGTATQFGGTSQPNVQGHAIVALRAGASAAPCNGIGVGGFPTGAPNPACRAGLSVVTPGALGPVGGPLGFFVKTFVPAQPVYQIAANANGTILSTGAVVGALPAGNSVTSYGGPWTTGTVVVSVPTGAEKFWLKGGDNRVNGVGSISLVAGGVSFRTLSKGNANRGWQNLVVGAALPTVPSVSNTGLALLAMLFAAATTWMVRRSFVRAS